MGLSVGRYEEPLGGSRVTLELNGPMRVRSSYVRVITVRSSIKGTGPIVIGVLHE